MKSTFKNTDPETVTPGAEEEKPSTKLAAPVHEMVAPPSDSYFNNEGIEGDFDKSDRKVPTLKLVHGVGPMSENFTPGTFVYNGETVVGKPVLSPSGVVLGTDGLIITLVGMLKYYLEDLPYGSDVFPAKFNSAAEALNAGFLPVDQKRSMGDEHRYFKPLADATVFIKGDDSNITFPLNHEGVPYAVARWTLQSTAYNRVAKTFLNDSLFALRAGLTTKYYTVSAKKDKLGANLVFVPKVVLTGNNTESFRAFIKSIGI